jgi:uncharacterized protein involved in exopolysaccharide biosynthesis
LVLSDQQLQTASTELKTKQAELEFRRAVYDNEPDSIPESEAMAALAGTAAGKAVVPANDAESKARDMELQIFDLRESLKDYRPLHSKYTLIGEEIEDLEGKIAMLRGESAQTAISARSTRWVPNPRRALYEQEISNLGTTIAGLEKTVSTLTTSIAELSQLHEQRQEVYLQLNILDQEVSRANETYLNTDDFYQRQVTRLQMLEGPEANPFEVVEVAKDDGIPSAPNVLMWIAGSALLGLALGLGSALASEFLRNGSRGISDLTRGLATPVLGSINLIVTRDEARRAWTRHVMIAASSAVIVGAVLWVTWASQHDSLRLLGPRLTQVIDDVRMAFRP